MRKLLDKILLNLGYENSSHKPTKTTSNKKETTTISFPYVQSYKVQDCNFDLWIVDETGRTWYPPGDRDRVAELVELARLVQPGDRVLELGTHHGFYAMFLSRLVGSEGYVLGIEASPPNAQIAQSQVTLNNLGNVCMVKNFAASDSPGTVSITKRSCASVVSKSEVETIDVEAVTGDMFAKEYGPFNVLKLDVEGFEGQVLSGCKEILSSKPKLAIELHVPILHQYQTSVEEIFRLIGIENYEGVIIERSNKYQSKSFSVDSIPNDIVNLLLRPKANV
jgi:FkbM family methyltransferase